MKHFSIMLVCLIIVLSLTMTNALAFEPASSNKSQTLPKYSHFDDDIEAYYDGGFGEGPDEIIVGDDISDPNQETIEYKNVTAKVGSNNLTITLRGLTDANCIKVLSLVEKNIDQLLEDGQHVKIIMPDFLDAEKYTNIGYDSDLCWCAAASNLLWSSRYAQIAINPITNKHFRNTDEVFDYYRKCFTDEGGVVESALNWFFNGNYNELNLRGFAQPKPNAIGNLLPNENPEIIAEYKDYELLNKLENYAIEAMIDWYDYIEDKFDDVRHSVTVVGIIYDDSATTAESKYKAIILADSDNDKDYSASSTVPDQEKAAKAALHPNSYIMYSLSYTPFNVGENGNIEFESFLTVGDCYGNKHPITWIRAIKDREVNRHSVITWLDENGKVINKEVVENGKTPTHSVPTKQATVEKTYAFAGWSPALVPVTGPATYQATFTEAAATYTITWKNDDGTVIDTTTVDYGKLPTHADPIKTETSEHKYVFAGWEPQIVAVTGNAEYKATFSEVAKYYA